MEGNNELNRNIDYIVEENENENGKYRKWASGILEQWVIKNVTCAVNNSYGSYLYLGTYYWYYPIDFYKQPDYVICPKAQWDTGASWPCILGYTETYANIRIFDAFSRPATANKLRIMAYAKGKWK